VLGTRALSPQAIETSEWLSAIMCNVVSFHSLLLLSVKSSSKAHTTASLPNIAPPVSHKLQHIRQWHDSSFVCFRLFRLKSDQSVLQVNLGPLNLERFSDTNAAKAHGATGAGLTYTKDQYQRSHELADHEISLGDQKRSIVNDETSERHHVSEDQLGVVAKRREQSILAHRKESEKIFASDRKSISRQG